MDKRKRNLSIKGHPVLVYRVVVVKVRKVMILTVNTAIEEMIKLNQNIRTKKLNLIMLNGNEDHDLEIGVNHTQDQSVVGHIPDTEVIHIQDIMIDDLHIIIELDVVDHLYHVKEVPENIKANVIVLLVQMNQEVLNTTIDDNIIVKNYC